LVLAEPVLKGFADGMSGPDVPKVVHAYQGESMPRVLLFPVSEDPQDLNIATGLQAMQDLVGGYIENVTLEDGVGLICNEEGKLKGLPMNRRVKELNDIIRGPFFISRYNDEGETVDITDADVKKFTKRFPRG